MHGFGADSKQGPENLKEGSGLLWGAPGSRETRVAEMIDLHVRGLARGSPGLKTSPAKLQATILT